MSDTETLGVKSRKRKSTSRRLSILKGPKSPMRNALGDLDPNSDAVEDVQCRQEFKKSKRLSRRVSFAETYEVKEYLKDADALSMGMWHQRDGSAENVPENETDQAQRAISGDSTQNLSRAEVQHPPQIQGLESLLSGQIKNPVALYNTQDSQENAYYDSKTDVGGNMVEDNKTDSQYLSKDPEAENQSKIDSSMFTKKFISKIDGSMFLKKLMNDGESTSMSTGRGISSYQQSCISQVQEDVPSDDCTVHFKTSENDMDITRCQDTTATLPYTVFPPDTGGLPLSDIKKDQLIDRNDTIEPNMTMEFTQCHGSSLQSDVVPTMQYPSSAEDHTVHFRAAENDMDITRCQDTTASLPNVAFSHGHTLTGNKQVQQFPESAGADTVVSDDHTVHFRAAENDMDLTRCQDTTASLPNVAFSHGHTLTGNKQVQQFPESAGANTVVSDDHTVHFRAAENDMDITRCQDTTGTLPYTEFHSVTNDNTLPGNKTVQQHPDSARDWFPTSTNPCNKSENQQQNLPLKIFNSKNIMAKFDQSLEARLPSQNYSNYSLGSNPEDRRRRFSTGRKFSDQTEPLENVEIEGSTVPEFASDTTLHLDQTMDITLCNSTGILESTNTIMHALDKEIADREFKSSVQVGMEQKQFIADGEKAELDSDGKTRNFTSEDITGCMEMTTCVGSIVSEKPQDISKLQALSRRMRRISNISQDPDKTRVFTFDDDTAAMEFTTCNSYIPIQSSSSGSIAHAKRQDLCPVGPAEQTMIFEEDNGMDMTCATVHVDVPSLITSDRTACNINVASSLHDEHGQAMSMLEDYHMGEPNSSVQAAKDGNSSIDNCHDKTHVFSDDTAAMEMTAVMESTDQIKQSTLSEVDKTKMSCSDTTATMEQTKCITFPNLETSTQLPMCDKSEVVDKDNTHTVEVFKQSSSPELIMTDHLKSIQQVNVQPVENLISTSFIVSGQESVTPNASNIVDISKVNVPPVDTKISTSFTVSSQETVTANTNKSLGSSKRDSDTFVIDHNKDSNTFVGDKSVTESNPQDPNNMEHGGNLDDTFTVQPSVTTQTADSNDLKENSKNQKVCDWPKNVVSEGGIMDEEPMNFEDITDHGETSKAGLSRSLNSTSVTQDTTCLNKSDIRALSMFDGDGTDQMHLPEGNISVAEFCQYFQIFSFRKEGRRSTLAPVSVQPVESISDYLELLCIIQPQYLKYEWAIDHLTKQTEKMLAMASASEKELTENNPPLFDEIRNASPDKLNEFRSRLKSLHHACNKFAKLNWSKWKAKLNSSLLVELKDEHSWLTEQNDKIHGDNIKLVKSLETLSKVDSDLDAAIAELELHELPTEDELQKLKTSEELKNELKLKNAQLEALLQKQTILDKTRNEAFAEKESLQATEEKLREQQAESVDIDSAKKEVQDAFNKVDQLQRLFEWELKEWNQYEALYTFLLSSISMELTFGKTLDNTLAYGKPEKEIVNIKLESLLAEDASPCAHLAHRMVLGALDHVSLQQKYPTTRWLPTILTHTSYVVCQTRQLVRELDHLMFRYEVEIKDTCVAVEFSDIANLAKFVVQFHLIPGGYPNSKIQHSFTNVMGNISSDVITSSLSAVKPGFKYLCRQVESIEQMLRHSSSQ